MNLVQKIDQYNKEANLRRRARTIKIVLWCRDVLYTGVPALIDRDLIKETFPPEPPPPHIDIMIPRQWMQLEIEREISKICEEMNVMAQYPVNQPFEVLLFPPENKKRTINGVELEGVDVFLPAIQK